MTTIPRLVEPVYSTSNYALADATRAKPVPGRRVLVNRWSPTLHGLHGVIVTPRDGEQVGEGDCAVLLDERDYLLGFFWNELELQP